MQKSSLSLHSLFHYLFKLMSLRSSFFLLIYCAHFYTRIHIHYTRHTHTLFILLAILPLSCHVCRAHDVLYIYFHTVYSSVSVQYHSTPVLHYTFSMSYYRAFSLVDASLSPQTIPSSPFPAHTVTLIKIKPHVINFDPHILEYTVIRLRVNTARPHSIAYSAIPEHKLLLPKIITFFNCHFFLM